MRVASPLRAWRLIAWVLAFLLTTTCKSDDPGASTRARPAPASARPLRIALSAAFVAEHGVSVYQRIVEYLQRKLGQELELVTGLGYETINSMLDEGAIDMAFVSGYPYVLLRDRPDGNYDDIRAHRRVAEAAGFQSLQ